MLNSSLLLDWMTSLFSWIFKPKPVMTLIRIVGGFIWEPSYYVYHKNEVKILYDLKLQMTGTGRDPFMFYVGYAPVLF